MSAQERGSSSVNVTHATDEPYEIIVVGAGIAGTALSTALGKAGRRVLCLERSLKEPETIIGELLQPGGCKRLKELGLEECLEGIDSPLIYGYSVFHDKDKVKIPYPKENNKPAIGRSFHHGRFVMRLREQMFKQESVTVLEATVVDLISNEDNTRIHGIVYKDKDDTLHEVRAPLTVVCDGSGSILRKHITTETPTVRSHFVGVVMENCADKIPFPNHGHVFLVSPSPVLCYPISSTEVRVLVDIPGYMKMPNVATGEMAEYLITKIAPQLAPEIQEHFIRAVQGGRIRSMPNKVLPGRPYVADGVILLGDAFNTRHPLTGGGMTVALSDCVLIRDMIASLRDLNDVKAFRAGMKQFYKKRKHVASTINILAAGLYGVFAANDDPALPYMRKACIDYFKLGGICISGPVGFLSGLMPRPYYLFTHFFAVAWFGVVQTLFPIPWPNKIARAFNIIKAATLLIRPAMTAENYFNWLPFFGMRQPKPQPIKRSASSASASTNKQQ